VLAIPDAFLSEVAIPPAAEPAVEPGSAVALSLPQPAAAEANQQSSSQQLPTLLARVCMIAASRKDSCWPQEQVTCQVW
jgi:hypothetical protein